MGRNVARTLTTIASFRDRSLIATFFRYVGPLLIQWTVDWQVADKIDSLSFYTKMKGFYQLDFLITNTELRERMKILCIPSFQRIMSLIFLGGI